MGSRRPLHRLLAPRGHALWSPGQCPHSSCPPLCAGEVQAFYEDLSGRQYVNEIFNFSVDKLFDLLFTDSPFQRDFMEQRRFSGASPGLALAWPPPHHHPLSSLPKHLLSRAMSPQGSALPVPGL